MQNCVLIADSGYAQSDFVITLVEKPGTLINSVSGILQKQLINITNL